MRNSQMPNDPNILFPAGVVGSMPRPAFVKDLVLGDHDLPPSEYQRRLDAAVRYVVALQEQAGLDVITDGEWRRKSYIGVIAQLAHGFEATIDPATGRPQTVVVDRLAAKDPGHIAREVRFLKSITQKRIKATLPAPALLAERMWSAERSAGATVLSVPQINRHYLLHSTSSRSLRSEKYLLVISGFCPKGSDGLQDCVVLPTTKTKSWVCRQV